MHLCQAKTEGVQGSPCTPGPEGQLGASPGLGLLLGSAPVFIREGGLACPPPKAPPCSILAASGQVDEQGTVNPCFPSTGGVREPAEGARGVLLPHLSPQQLAQLLALPEREHDLINAHRTRLRVSES